jgi:hypothetical protein
MSSKKDRKHNLKPVLSSSLPEPPPLSKKGWKIFLGGIIFVITGFFVLSLTDSRGQNWASTASPFILVGGYALIAVGLIVKE